MWWEKVNLYFLHGSLPYFQIIYLLALQFYTEKLNAHKLFSYYIEFPKRLFCLEVNLCCVMPFEAYNLFSKHCLHCASSCKITEPTDKTWIKKQNHKTSKNSHCFSRLFILTKKNNIGGLMIKQISPKKIR